MMRGHSKNDYSEGLLITARFPMVTVRWSEVVTGREVTHWPYQEVIGHLSYCYTEPPAQQMDWSSVWSSGVICLCHTQLGSHNLQTHNTTAALWRILIYIHLAYCESDSLFLIRACTFIKSPKEFTLITWSGNLTDLMNSLENVCCRLFLCNFGSVEPRLI